MTSEEELLLLLLGAEKVFALDHRIFLPKRKKLRFVLFFDANDFIATVLNESFGHFWREDIASGCRPIQFWTASERINDTPGLFPVPHE